jgi:hypothetical protein
MQSGWVSSSPLEQCRIPSHRKVRFKHFPSKHVYSSNAQLAVQLNSSVLSIQSGVPSHTRLESIHWHVLIQENDDVHVHNAQFNSSDPSLQSLCVSHRCSIGKQSKLSRH